jgi:hypothetical protein
MIAALIATKLMTSFGLGPKAAKAVAWLGLLAFAALLVWGAIWWFTDTVGDARDAGVKQGVTTERVEAQGKVIENVQKAKAAADEYRSDPAVRDAGCLLDATAPEDC